MSSIRTLTVRTTDPDEAPTPIQVAAARVAAQHAVDAADLRALADALGVLTALPAARAPQPTPCAHQDVYTAWTTSGTPYRVCSGCGTVR
jgi:hypothetical protein